LNKNISSGPALSRPPRPLMGNEDEGGSVRRGTYNVLSYVIATNPSRH